MIVEHTNEGDMVLIGDYWYPEEKRMQSDYRCWFHEQDEPARYPHNCYVIEKQGWHQWIPIGSAKTLEDARSYINQYI